MFFIYFLILQSVFKIVFSEESFIDTLKSFKTDAFNNNVDSYPAINDADIIFWPNGVIPYYFDLQNYDYLISFAVRMVMNKIEAGSCIKFQPLLVRPAADIKWLHFTNPKQERGCVHELQHVGLETVVVLGYDCLKKHEILHTVLHAVGFKDEVTHPHRDKYVRVMWENIHPEYRKLFAIQRAVSANRILEYDPTSIMHFHDRAFSKNGRATIETVAQGMLINPSTELSQLDGMKLRILYGQECNKRKAESLLKTCKNLISAQINGDANVTPDKIPDDHIHLEDNQTDGESLESIVNNKETTDNTMLSNELKETPKKLCFGVPCLPLEGEIPKDGQKFVEPNTDINSDVANKDFSSANKDSMEQPHEWGDLRNGNIRTKI